MKQESLFYWTIYESPTYVGKTVTHLMLSLELQERVSSDEAIEPSSIGTTYAAFTVAELGQMLPHTEECISRREPSGDWRCGNQIEATEADARAKMLIYLLENNLLTHEA